jgi:hypothetical protein
VWNTPFGYAPEDSHIRMATSRWSCITILLEKSGLMGNYSCLVLRSNPDHRSQPYLATPTRSTSPPQDRPGRFGEARRRDRRERAERRTPCIEAWRQRRAPRCPRSPAAASAAGRLPSCRTPGSQPQVVLQPNVNRVRGQEARRMHAVNKTRTQPKRIARAFN